MNGKNITTGTVHTMTSKNEQACGIRANQVATLVATTEAITCRKCSKGTPAVTAPVTEKPAITPAMGKVLKVLAGGEWTSWSALPAGLATLAKMVKLNLIEANASETQYRSI